MSNSASRETEDLPLEDPFYRHYSSSLRIAGDGIDFDEISRTLGLKATHTQRKGELRKPGLKPWPRDEWIYRPEVGKDRPLDEHIMAIWNAIRPHIPFLRQLKEQFQVEVFFTYASNRDMWGFQIDYRCLGLFRELEIPFEVSILAM